MSWGSRGRKGWWVGGGTGEKESLSGGPHCPRWPQRMFAIVRCDSGWCQGLLPGSLAGAGCETLDLLKGLGGAQSLSSMLEYNTHLTGLERR